MDKPAADRIEGIPPAIAIEQRNAVRTTRSTVGTMTEVCDYMKMLWPHLAQLHCRQCGLLSPPDPRRRSGKQSANRGAQRRTSHHLTCRSGEAREAGPGEARLPTPAVTGNRSVQDAPPRLALATSLTVIQTAWRWAANRPFVSHNATIRQGNW
jgi:hypothetical protein